jgi:hypothetical protein
MTDDRPIVRAAWHEAAHAVAAYIHRLPLRETWIDEAGYGKTCYTRRLHRRRDIEAWLVATMAGPAVELAIWGNAPIEGDLKVIDRMVRDMGLSEWSDAVLDRYRIAAKEFVHQQAARIETVAEELLQRHRLTGADIQMLLGCRAFAGSH